MTVTARRYVHECAVSKGGVAVDAGFHAPKIPLSNGTSTRRRAGMCVRVEFFVLAMVAIIRGLVLDMPTHARG